MKNKKAVFFDLDGTLLPVDLDRMFSAYFELLKKSELIRLISKDIEKALEIFNAAATVMMANRGGKPNNAVFLDYLEKMTGRAITDWADCFNAYYATVFDSLGWMIRNNGIQRKIVDTVLGKGYKTALATMPVFPIGAAKSRLSWVGLSPKDFEYISHWENSSYMKPHPGYYTEILSKMGLEAKDCIMVGNNVKEDMCAQELGFDVFLVTGFEIGTYKEDAYACGDLSALLEWVRSLPLAEGYR